ITHLPESETTGHHRSGAGANAPTILVCRRCYWPRPAVAMLAGAQARRVAKAQRRAVRLKRNASSRCRRRCQAYAVRRVGPPAPPPRAVVMAEEAAGSKPPWARAWAWAWAWA